MVLEVIRAVRVSVIFVLTILFLTILITKNAPADTNLAKAILPETIIKNTKIIPLINHSASTVKVVFESDNSADISEIKQNFFENIDKKSFTPNSADFSELLDLYRSEPQNFISAKTRNLLKNKEYDAVYQEGLGRLYNPTGFFAVSLDKDPFMLLTDFLYSNNTIRKNHNIGGKYYDTEILQLNKNADRNESIKGLLMMGADTKCGHIYFAGTPIHAYNTTLTSTISVNLICILITFLIIFLTYFYFKNFQILLPIILSISFGFLAGYSATRYIFGNFHIVTLLFGTTLIGIGVDYSYHFIFKENFDREFVKNLTLSLISTIGAFSLLCLAKTDILNQISVFTIAGLTAIYIFIMLLYPMIKFPEVKRVYEPRFDSKFKRSLIILIFGVIILGLPRIGFDDNLTALYKPNRALQKAESLFNKIENQEVDKNSIIAIKGTSVQEILEKEESVTSILDRENINYICVSKFFPSIKKQIENSELIKDLYRNRLDKYREFLSDSQINALREKSNQGISLNIENVPFFKNLFLDSKTSMIIAFSDTLPEIKSNNIEIISIQNTMSEHLKKHRHNLQNLLPLVYVLLFFILFITFGFRKSIKMSALVLISQVFTVAFMSLIGIKLNMFTILGLILSLGFTVDYVIFSEKNVPKTNAAIFLSCITTALSFLLLVFTTFKLISVLALTTSLCIISSYLLTRLFAKDTNKLSYL